MTELWRLDREAQPFVSLGTAARAAVEHLSVLAGFVMPDQVAQNSYDFWEAILRGEEPDLPRDVPMFGRYWRRQRDGKVIGVAIDPDDDDVTPVVCIGKQPPFTLPTQAACEDFCELQFSWFCRNAVTHEAYLVWWKTGEWPEGAIKERPKPGRARKAAAPKPEPVVEPAASLETAAPAIRIRAYASIGASDPDEAFYARAIRYAKGRETASVGFYGETAEAATAKAVAWIDVERAKAERVPPRRKPASPDQSATAA